MNWVVGMNRCTGPVPCTVCGKPPSKHGSYPTCATHPYTSDRTCQHVLGATCVGLECINGCVRGRARVEPVAGPSSEPARSNKKAPESSSAAPVEAVEVLRAERYRDALVWALGAHETDGFRERYAGDPAYWWRKELAERAGLRWDCEKYIDVGAQPPQAVQEVRLLTSGETNPILDEIVGNYPVDLAEQVQRKFCEVNASKRIPTDGKLGEQ